MIPARKGTSALPPRRHQRDCLSGRLNEIARLNRGEDTIDANTTKQGPTKGRTNRDTAHEMDVTGMQPVTQLKNSRQQIGPSPHGEESGQGRRLRGHKERSDVVREYFPIAHRDSEHTEQRETTIRADVLVPPLKELADVLPLQVVGQELVDSDVEPLRVRDGVLPREARRRPEHETHLIKD